MRHKTRCEVSKRNLRGILYKTGAIGSATASFSDRKGRIGNLAGMSPLAGTPGMILFLLYCQQPVPDFKQVLLVVDFSREVLAVSLVEKCNGCKTKFEYDF